MALLAVELNKVGQNGRTGLVRGLVAAREHDLRGWPPALVRHKDQVRVQQPEGAAPTAPTWISLDSQRQRPLPSSA